jgi:hypothetical protein
MQLVATLHLIGLRTVDHLTAHVEAPARRHPAGRSGDRGERGSVTIEQVLWAVALIAIVAIVVTAIKTFVTDKAADIK